MAKKPSRELTDQEKAAQEEMDICSLFKRVFSGKDGEKVLEILAKEHHLLSGTFRENPNNMYFVEGERHVVRSILRRIEIDEVAAMKRLRDYYDNSLNGQ